MTGDAGGGDTTIGTNPDPDQLRRVLASFAGKRVLVIGDLMVDEYVDGAPSRVSPEAPVPVIEVRDEWWGVGAAANVAHQVHALGGRAVLCGVVGDDEAGDRLRQRSREIGIDTDGVVTDPSRRTTRKLRVLGRGQQTVRVDFEDTQPLDGSALREVVDFISVQGDLDAVVVSDYGKGVVHPDVIAAALSAARASALPCLVDPAAGPLGRYAGADLIKANAREFAAARAAAGLDAREPTTEAVRELFESCDASALVVTAGARGALVALDDGRVSEVPPVPCEVVDVAGAGDTAMAVLTLGITSGVDLVDSVALANLAASAVVRRRGVAVVGPSDVLALAGAPTRAAASLSLDELLELARRWRRDGRRIVLTNGCFDLLHPGHVHLLRSAAEMGDVLVVALNSDRSVRGLKGPGRPVLPAGERARQLDQLSWVDAVVEFDDPTPIELVRALRPDVLVKGGDYSVEEIVGADDVISSGGEVATVSILPGWSTSRLVEERERAVGR